MCTVSTSKSPDEASPSHYHHGNLRQALLQAGLERLESTQNPEFRLRELTRRVGVSVNAAYRHFASKEALLAAMAAEGFHRLVVAQAQAIMGNPDKRMGFVEAGRAYVNFARRHPALFRLMYSRFAATNQDQAMHASAQLAYSGMLYALASVLGKPADDPEVKVGAIQAWSLVHGLSLLIIDGQVDGHTDNVDALLDAVFKAKLESDFLQKK